MARRTRASVGARGKLRSAAAVSMMLDSASLALAATK
jgi:hypothetical protein